LLVVFDSSAKVVRLWFLSTSDFTFDIINISGKFISFVVMVNDVKIQVVGVYSVTTYNVHCSLWSSIVISMIFCVLLVILMLFFMLRM